MTRMLIAVLSVVGVSMVSPVQARAQTSGGKAVTAAGTVKSVSTESLTITSAGQDLTFKVDGRTKFIAKGLSTKSAKNKIMAPDAVGANDVVRVTYRDAGGVLRAASVRVTAKAGPRQP
jgi:hypothetical protein